MGTQADQLMYGPLLSGVLPAIRSNFSLMLLSSAIPSLTRQYQSTMARNIKNNAIPIAADDGGEGSVSYG
jgi:hypothetical protein